VPNAIWIVIGIIAVLVLLVLVAIVGQFISLYIQAFVSNAKVSLIDIIGMRLRKVDIRAVVYSRIRAVKAGIPISTGQLDEHYLGGDDDRQAGELELELDAPKRAPSVIAIVDPERGFIEQVPRPPRELLESDPDATEPNTPG